jgi:hypothetical protein
MPCARLCFELESRIKKHMFVVHEQLEISTTINIQDHTFVFKHPTISIMLSSYAIYAFGIFSIAMASAIPDATLEVRQSAGVTPGHCTGSGGVCIVPALNNDAYKCTSGRCVSDQVSYIYSKHLLILIVLDYLVGSQFWCKSISATPAKLMLTFLASARTL